MSSVSESAEFFMGWDVGGWNCDKNPQSRDAIVILDASLAIMGKPWRGNLRATLNAATSSQDWMRALFALCGADRPTEATRVTLAIDTPLGFSQAFAALITGQMCREQVQSSATNPYLFRQTERSLFERGLQPLSAIKDMIGSQATKGMHALAKFAPEVTRCGVWTDGHALTVIEAYPSPCRHSTVMDELLLPYADWRQDKHQDKVDALVCALTAYCFVARPHMLLHPAGGVPVSEGWIWLPQDALPGTRCESEKAGNTAIAIEIRESK